MTPDQIQIVRSTFGRVYRTPEETGDLFYGRLFAMAPEVRPLFKGDMARQSRKLMDTLNVAVATLRDPASLQDILARMGRDHAAYGVQDRHYDAVGAALIWTLDRKLGPAFTPEARAAWTALYGTVSAAMKAAAAPGATAAAA